MNEHMMYDVQKIDMVHVYNLLDRGEGINTQFCIHRVMPEFRVLCESSSTPYGEACHIHISSSNSAAYSLDCICRAGCRDLSEEERETRHGCMIVQDLVRELNSALVTFTSYTLFEVRPP